MNNDLASCGTSTCITTANAPNTDPVNAWTQITGSFSGVGTLQTTSFLGGKNATDSMCQTTRKYIGQGFDQRVLSAPSAGFQGYQVIVIPKQTLKDSGVLSRGTPSFDLCFGAIWTPGGTPTTIWKGKKPSGSGLQNAVPATDFEMERSADRAIPTNCGARKNPVATDPCIALEDKATIGCRRAHPGDQLSDQPNHRRTPT